MFRKGIYLSINCFIFLLPILMLGQELSMEDCIEIAIKNNPSIRRAELQYERTKIDKQQAWQNALPSIEGGVGHSWNKGKSIDPTTNQFIEQTISSGNASISAGMYLFNGFKVLHDIRKQVATKKAGKLEYKSQEESLILDVIEAYITVLTARDLLQQAENQLFLSQKHLAQAESLHQEGSIDPGDYHDLKGEYNENKNTVTTAHQLFFHSRVKLSGLLHLSEENLPDLQSLSVIEKKAKPSASEILEKGKLRPFYALWEWRIEEAKQNIRIAQADYYPSLSVSTGMNTRYSNSSELNFWDQNKNNLGKYISLNLHIPIFNGFTVRNNVKRAKINLQDVLWQKQITENSLREATSKAVFDLDATKSSIENLKKQEESYAESFRIAQAKFGLGASNSVLYLTVKNKWENSKNQLVIKQYEWMLQKYINDYYLGEGMF